MGLELNSSGDPTGGDHPTSKLPYSGPATGFTVTIEGDTHGVPIRIGFTQEPFARGVSPYYQVPGTGTYTFHFSDATYPSWCPSHPLCGKPVGQQANPAGSYYLQFQLAGGESNSAFDYRITSLVAF